MPEPLESCYRLLDVGPEASADEIRKAYLVLVNVWHPDRFVHDAALQTQAEEKLKTVNEAFDKIRNAPLRRGEAAAATPPPGPTRSAREWLELGVRLTRNPIRLRPGQEVTWASVSDLAEYFEGTRALREALRLQPNWAPAWYALGLAASHLRESAQALEAFSNVVRIDPAHAGGWMNLGAVHAQRDEFEQAVAAFRQAVRVRPGDGSCWHSLGVAHERLGQHEAAVAAYREALRLDRNLAETWLALGVALAFPPADGQVDPEGALTAFREAVQLKPDLSEAWHRLGATLSGLRRHEAAIDALREAVRIKPDHVEAWYQLGVAAVFASRPDSQRILGEALRNLDRLDRNEASRLRGLVPYHLRAALFGQRLAARTLSALRRNHAETA